MLMMKQYFLLKKSYLVVLGCAAVKTTPNTAWIEMSSLKKAPEDKSVSVEKPGY